MHPTRHARAAGGAIVAFAAAAATGIAVPATAAVEVTVTIENLSPANGTWLSPVWLGFHDGSFDVFDEGSAAAPGIERIAEAGNPAVLRDAFSGAVPGGVDRIFGKGPIAPGARGSLSVEVDESNRWLSYASMILPSNDAFVGNDDPTGIELFDADGTFVGADFFITGADIRDAGTEVNDELPEHTAFFGQTDPFAGDDEAGVVTSHPGFLGSLGNPGTPSILADPEFAGADFTIPGYPVARVTIVPAPGALVLLGVAGLFGPRRRRR